jgi:hypothetical protein
MAIGRRPLLMSLAALLPAAGVQASTPPAEVRAEWPQALLVGSGRLRFMGLLVYEARLWVPGPPAALDSQGWAAQPFALEIVYARSLQGAAIASRSLDEMRRQGEPDPATAERWLQAMKTTFPDVREGDRLVGLHQPGDGARFLFNGAARGQWREATLAQRFFGIWLAPQTSEPKLREALLGGRS